MSTWTHERARVAALSRGVRAGERTQAELDAARQALREARATDYVQKLVDSAPPLSDEVRNRLAELLRPVQR